MTTFWWVRHGPTHERAFVGWRDVPADLSDTAAIARLSAYLPQGAPVVCSDLIRASATAAAIAGPRPRLPDDPDLREFNLGDWDGKHFEEVAASHPDLSRAYWERPGDIAPPNGESWNQAAGRVSAAVDRLARTHGGDLILVAHIGVILTQIARAGGLTPENALGHRIDNLSVTRVSAGPQGWQLGEINHCP